MRRFLTEKFLILSLKGTGILHLMWIWAWWCLATLWTFEWYDDTILRDAVAPTVFCLGDTQVVLRRVLFNFFVSLSCIEPRPLPCKASTQTTLVSHSYLRFRLALLRDEFWVLNESWWNLGFLSAISLQGPGWQGPPRLIPVRLHFQLYKPKQIYKKVCFSHTTSYRTKIPNCAILHSAYTAVCISVTGHFHIFLCSVNRQRFPNVTVFNLVKQFFERPKSAPFTC